MDQGWPSRNWVQSGNLGLKKISKVWFLLRSNFASMSYGFTPARNGLKHSGNLAKTNLSISAKFVKISIKYLQKEKSGSR